MTDRSLFAMFLVVGVVIAVVNPILGAMVMFPACVVWVARRLTK